jgi:hypothetical protein
MCKYETDLCNRLDRLALSWKFPYLWNIELFAELDDVGLEFMEFFVKFMEIFET